MQRRTGKSSYGALQQRGRMGERVWGGKCEIGMRKEKGEVGGEKEDKRREKEK